MQLKLERICSNFELDVVEAGVKSAAFQCLASTFEALDSFEQGRISGWASWRIQRPCYGQICWLALKESRSLCALFSGDSPVPGQFKLRDSLTRFSGPTDFIPRQAAYSIGNSFLKDNERFRNDSLIFSGGSLFKTGCLKQSTASRKSCCLDSGLQMLDWNSRAPAKYRPAISMDSKLSKAFGKKLKINTVLWPNPLSLTVRQVLGRMPRARLARLLERR